MKTQHEYWTIDKLTKSINQIEFPEFQREPTVWNLDKKQRLIDSILREFDISSIYFYKKENGGFDCVDGRQRINAILSYLAINDYDEDHNGFNLRIENEIYDDRGIFDKVEGKRYDRLDDSWKKKIKNYKLNIVIITNIEYDEELNLLFLRLQIASVLNAGEKLKAMTGEMRDWIYHEIIKHNFFKKIKIPQRRFAKEQVAAQIALNFFSKKNNGTFHRSRYIDLQDFFKQYSKFRVEDKKLIEEIEINLNKINTYFNNKLKYINNRAIAVSICLLVSDLIDQDREQDINKFVEFLIKFLKTLKWQIPKGIEMDKAYKDLQNFQTNITQAAGEKSAIQKRHDFLNDYFYYYLKEGLIKGDKEYKQENRKNPDNEREKIRL